MGLNKTLFTGIIAGMGGIYAQAQAILRSFGSNAHSYPFATLAGAYQTSTGPAAVAVNDPVGFEFDAMGVVGPNLVTNGDFSSGATGWIGDAGALAAIGGGVYNLGLVATGNSIGQACLTVGQWYKLTFSVTRFSVLGAFRVRIGGGGANDLNLAINAVGSYTIYGQATVDNLLTFVRYAASDFDIDNVVVREVTGNHATQPTAINRPTLQRGLWNLLMYSQDFSNAVWTKQAGASVTSTTKQDPTGESTATEITWTSTAVGAGIFQSGLTVNGAANTKGVWIRSSSSGTVVICDPNTTAGTTTVTLSTSWQLATLSEASGVQTGGGGIWVKKTALSPDTFEVWNAMLTLGTLTADQILQQGGIPLTTASAGSNPTAGPYWASFNGTNQSMALTSVPFQMSDDFAVVACINLLPSSAWSTILSIGGAGVQRIQFYLEHVTGFAGCYFRDDAGVGVDVYGAVGLYNVRVVVCIAKRGSSVYLRVNRVQVATGSVASLGASTFTEAIIGKLSIGSEYSNGAIYDLDVIKGTVTDAQLLVLEKTAAQKAGITI